MPLFSIRDIRSRWSHEGFQKYLKNTGWLFFARFVTLAVSFFTNIFVVRYLGPTNNGMIGYAVSYVGLFSFVANLGIDQVIYRDLIKFPEKNDRLLGTAFILKLFGAIAAISLIGIFSFYTETDPLLRFLIVINSLGFLFIPFGIISYFFQAKVRSKYASLLNIIGVAILAALKLLVVYFNKGIIYFSLILMLESFIYAVISIYFYKKMDHSIFKWRASWSEARKMLNDSWPLLFSAVFILIYTRIDQIMIGKFLNIEAVGLYDAAARLSEVWYFIPALFLSSLFPAVINAKKTDFMIYKNRLILLYSIMFYAGVGVALIVSILSKFIILTLYGTEFLASAPILSIYVWGGIAVFINMALNNYFVAENQTKEIFFSTFLGMITNVILNLFLIPKYGMVGAAFSTLISYSLIPLTAIIISKQRVLKIQMVFKAIALPITLWTKKS